MTMICTFLIIAHCCKTLVQILHIICIQRLCLYYFGRSDPKVEVVFFFHIGNTSDSHYLSRCIKSMNFKNM